MKANLTFDLTEERSELLLALRAGEMSSALWAIDQACRSALKYEELSDETRAKVQAIRDLIPSELLDP